MNTKLLKMLICFFTGVLLLTACEEDPSEVEATASFVAATSTDAWHYKFTNSSSVTGTCAWDFGDGEVGTGDVVDHYFPVKGEYIVELTLSASTGALTAKDTIVITESDAAFFAHPFFDALTGGLSNTSGKKWMMDKNLNGHYGLGPGSGDWSSYHASAGNGRAGFGYYDDELTFVLDGFVAQYYVGEDGKFVCRQPELEKKSDYYTNGIDPEGSAGFEYAVDYALASNAASPLSQTYTVSIEEGKGEGKEEDLIAITFVGDAPMNAFFDPGTVGSTWYVDEYDENHMTLYCQAAADYDIDGASTYYQIKMAAEGFLSMPATYTASAAVGAGGSVDFAVTYDSGADIESVVWIFGDNETGTGLSASHTYVSNMTYNAKAVVTDAIGVISETDVVVTVTSAADLAATLVDWASFDGTDPLTFSKMAGDDSDDGIVDDAGNAVLKATLSGQWQNTFAGFAGEIDLTSSAVVSFRVKGKAGQRLAVNLYNKTDFAAAPYGTDAVPLELFYTVLEDDIWEPVVLDFQLHKDFDAANQTGFYDDITIFLNPGDQPTDPNQVVYLDDFKGPALP